MWTGGTSVHILNRTVIKKSLCLGIVFLSIVLSGSAFQVGLAQTTVADRAILARKPLPVCKPKVLFTSDRRLRSHGRMNRKGLFATAAATSSLFRADAARSPTDISPVKATATKLGMMAYIASMCVALPITLFPPSIMHKTKIISQAQREHLSLRAGQFTSRWLMRLIPFAKVEVIPNPEENPEPSVWVCNHTSMLDIFFLLAADKKLRGRKKRPIKIIYWKQLEKNPITKLLFTRCGFIPVDMEANKPGEANNYNRSSFKSLLKLTKQAFEEGFDVGILPEGQLNPNPEKGLLPVFPGAFTLSKMSRRPIKMMALNGVHKLWHPDESVGMKVTGRKVKVRAYPCGRKFESSDEFVETFKTVVGEFGAKGEDLPEGELESWLNGSHWETVKKQ